MEMIATNRGRALRAATAIALLALAGCSGNGSEGGSAYAELRRAATGFIDRRGDATQGVTLSDAELNAAPVDVMLLDIPEFGSEVGLVQQAVNRDVVTWVTPEGYSVSLKQGQIVGTAGFGFDLSSADIPRLETTGGRVVRDHYRLQGDETIERFRYFCELSRPVGEQVVVTGRRFDTVRVDEACTDGQGETFTNRYWVDTRGVMRKSRQFVSPRLGYFELQDVHGGLR